mgnify:CR=1 FL=1
MAITREQRALSVWMRVGDQGDYESFATVEEAASRLAPAVADAISLFFGDGDAQLVRELTDDELETFAEALEQETSEYEELE